MFSSRGDAVGLQRARRGVCLIAALTTACAAALPAAADDVVRLPQDHEYQVILRNYIATLKAEDFAVNIEPLDFRQQWFRDDETLHRAWVAAQSFPTNLGLTLAPENFTLRAIESPDGIRMRAGQHGGAPDAGVSVHPEDTVWWSTWDYRGNPYRGSRTVRNRAFVVAAVDMIMLDKLHESGNDWVKNARRSDFLGGTMTWLALVHRDVRAQLPEQVRNAYETGLERLLDKLVAWGPTGVNENMDTKAIVAAAQLAAIFREGPVVEKARGYANNALKLVHPAGMIRDAGGLEASYNGCALFNMAWATSVMPWPELVDAQRRMSDLKAHLTLPEPDGVNFWGPSHFSTRTSADSANDQWCYPHRDIAIAMHTDEAVYLMFGGRRGRMPGWGAPDYATMAQGIKTAVDAFNRSLKPSQDRFGVWQASWWGSGQYNYACDQYPRGFYGLLRDARRDRHPATLPPLLRPDETFVRVFPSQDMPDVPANERDAFVVARFPEYAAIVYTGPIGFSSYMNLAGGCLSAFWTPTGGSLVLGRTGKPTEDPETARQSWKNWRMWPTHAVSGQTASGDAFSSARIRRRVSKVECEAGRQGAVVAFSGPIGKLHDESRAAQNGCIVGDVRYRRSMGLGPRGVVVETRIESDGKDRVTDLCEILPLAIRDEKLQVPPPERPNAVVPHRVVFRVGERVVAGGEEFVDGVTEVQIDRFAGGAVIRFEEPQRVRLGEAWTDDYQSAMSVRNLFIDLLRGRPGPLPSVSVRYRIEPKPLDQRP